MMVRGVVGGDKSSPYPGGVAAHGGRVRSANFE